MNPASPLLPQDPADLHPLATLAILEGPIPTTLAQDLLPDTLNLPQRLQQWQAAALIQPAGDNTYTIPPAVRDQLLSQLDQPQLQDLHRRAATHYGRFFTEEARRHLTQQGQSPSEAQIQSLARDRNGVLGHWVHQTDNIPHARLCLALALAWQRHLFAASEVEAAGEIVTAIYDILARWGQRDQAKALLQRSIATRQPNGRAVAQGNLATLLQEEGQLIEALAIYQELLQTFTTLNAPQQTAATLGQMSVIYTQLGNYDQAISHQQASLELLGEQGDREGEAIGLQQLALIHFSGGNYEAALAVSQAAEQLNRQLNRPVGVAYNLHQQGLIYSQTGQLSEAFGRFQDSLTINQQIGNEMGTADNLGELAKLWLAVGQPEQALPLLQPALDICRRHNSPKQGIILALLGQLHEQQADYPTALDYYNQAYPIYQQTMPTHLPTIEQAITHLQSKRPNPQSPIP